MRGLAGHRDAMARLGAVEHELARREQTQHREALRLVIVDPPAYVTQELGPRPNDPAGQRAWDHGARTIESYRQRHGAQIDPIHAGLGDRPLDPRDARAYAAASRRLDAVKVGLGIRDTRSPDLDIARSGDHGLPR